MNYKFYKQKMQITEKHTEKQPARCQTNMVGSWRNSPPPPSLDLDALLPSPTSSQINPISTPPDSPSTLSSRNEVKPPSYIKSIHETSQGESEAVQPQVNLDHFVSLLDKRGLKPWKVTASRDGQGTILWLQNGSYIDLTPEGEVILGGENQEQTRETLAPVGIHL